MSTRILAISLLCLSTAAAANSPPLYVEPALPPWTPIEVSNPHARGEIQKAQFDGELEAFKKKDAENAERAKGVKDVLKGAPGAAAAAYDYYKSLTPTDERMNPNFTPPGAPQVPSKCMENKKCRPCFEKAQENLNKSRKNLEKVRGIYDYTHRFAKSGQAFLSSVGSMAGAPVALQAMVENKQVDMALDDFDKQVKSKNEELLGKLRENLQEIAACESEFYKNDDWFNRYGFMYYQFMIARYSY